MTGPPVVIRCKMMSESTAKTHFLVLWCCTFMGLMVRWSGVGWEGGFEKEKKEKKSRAVTGHEASTRSIIGGLQRCASKQSNDNNPPDPPPLPQSGDVVRINFMHHFSALTFTSFTRSCGFFFPPPCIYLFQSKWLFHIKKG